MEKHDNDKIQNTKEISNDQSEHVSGGRRGLFSKINIFNTYCDFCDCKIDGKTCFGVPVLNDEKIMCSDCYKKQSILLGQDLAAQKWLGININKKMRQSNKPNIENK